MSNSCDLVLLFPIQENVTRTCGNLMWSCFDVSRFVRAMTIFVRWFLRQAEARHKSTFLLGLESCFSSLEPPYGSYRTGVRPCARRPVPRPLGQQMVAGLCRLSVCVAEHAVVPCNMCLSQSAVFTTSCRPSSSRARRFCVTAAIFRRYENQLLYHFLPVFACAGVWAFRWNLIKQTALRRSITGAGAWTWIV